VAWEMAKLWLPSPAPAAALGLAPPSPLHRGAPQQVHPGSIACIAKAADAGWLVNLRAVGEVTPGKLPAGSLLP
jgi:hypothetical protein